MNIFPERITDDDGEIRVQGGLTLRDYFAAQAISGLLHREDIYTITSMVTRAYEIADTMLEIRDL